MQIEELCERIRQPDGTAAARCVVAIDGGGGAGKSTLAGALASATDGQCVHIDDFYRPEAPSPEVRAEPCWFFDWRRLRDEVLAPFCEGRQSCYRLYNWEAGHLGTEQVHLEPHGLLVVEGISVLRRELREWVDIGIWVETPRHVRLARGLERDGEAARSTWLEYWMPEEERYFEAHRPREYADMIVSGLGD